MFQTTQTVCQELFNLGNNSHDYWDDYRYFKLSSLQKKKKESSSGIARDNRQPSHMLMRVLYTCDGYEDESDTLKAVNR